MSTIYKWIISSLECIPSSNGLENIVQTIHWRLNGNDGVNSAEIYNSISIDPPDPAEFIQYSSLTEEQVVTWLTDRLGEQGVSSAKAVVDTQLADLASPPVVSPALPWAASAN
jgi:hypothetical protein